MKSFDIFISFIAIHWSQKVHSDKQRPLKGCFTFLSQEWGFRHLLDGVSEEPVFLAGAGGSQPELGAGRGDRRHMFGANVFGANIFSANMLDANILGEILSGANILVQTLYAL